MSVCVVDWCNSPIVNKKRQRCNRHTLQLARFGKNFKTNRDPNDVVYYKDHAAIILRTNHHVKLCEVLVDLEDVQMLLKHRWNYSHTGYAMSTLIGCMHTLLLKQPKHLMCDHINRNKLDNRKSNLRPATISQNNQNTGIKSTNTSGYKGVYFRKDTKKWVARVTNGKDIYNLGCFTTPEDAALVYNAKAKELFGEFAYLNEVN